MNHSTPHALENVSIPTEIVPLWMIISTLSLSAIGLLSNLIIVIATIKTTQLQNRCGYLIALLATVDSIICAYLVQLRVHQLFGWFFIPNCTCFLISIHGIFCLSVQSFLGLSIGIDRLMAVATPIRYKLLPKWVHVFLVLSAFSYALIITAIGAIDVVPIVIAPVCMPPTAFNVRSRMVWILSSFAVGILTLVVYAVTNYKCVRMGRSVEKTNRASFIRLKKLLNSLTLVVVVYASTWFLTVVALLITQVWARDTPLARSVESHLAWLVIGNASLNFYIYLWRAPEYRRAFLVVLFPCGREARKDSSGCILTDANTRTTATLRSRKISASPSF